jgi:hypothetical protein
LIDQLDDDRFAAHLHSRGLSAIDDALQCGFAAIVNGTTYNIGL